MTQEIIPAQSRILALSGTRAATDSELVDSWLDSLGSPHTRRNFQTTARRFLAAPSGIRLATVEDVRESLDAITKGLSTASTRQYVLRVKSLLSYGHDLGYQPFNAGVAV